MKNHRKQSIKPWKYLLPLALGLTLCLSSLCHAEPGVSQVYVTEDGRNLLYVRDLPGKVQSYTALVGSQEANSDLLTAEQASQSETLRFRTALVVDNSLSVQRNYPKLQQVLTALVDGHAQGELFEFITFSDERHVINAFSEDYEAVKTSINSLTFSNQDAYLQDVLYETLTELNATDGAQDYKRIIVFSDGMNETPGGHRTTQEVMDQQKVHNIPIYCLASRWDQNTSGLDNLAALGRTSGGNYYSLDETEDTGTIVSDLQRDYNVWGLGVTIPAEACDGGVRSLRLNISTTGGEAVVTAQDVRMPQTPNAAALPSPTPVPTLSPTPLPTHTPVPTQAPEKKAILPMPVLIGGVIFLLLLVLVIVLLIFRGRKKTVKEDDQYFGDDEDEGVTQFFGPALQDPRRDPAEDERTLYHASTETTWIFSELNNPQRQYAIPVREEAVLGRNSDFCDYVIPGDKAIGRHHCKLISHEGRNYIEDLNSLNGTFVNRRRITQVTEVRTGDVIRFGNTELRLELRR